jgi:Y_Y_Y domain.
MKIIGALLIAFITIVGIAAATVDHVQITSPHNGDQFTLGNTIKIRSMVSGDNEGYMGARTFINGVRTSSSSWTPTVAGVYTIMVQAADNKEFTNPISDTVTVTVT